MDERLKLELINKAKKVRENAYVPYSKFAVGAALLTEDNKIFTGCNVENAAYGLSNCAERSAIFSAVSKGYRKFKAIVIIAESDNPLPPCGSCRQVLKEFGDDIEVIMSNIKGDEIIKSSGELLPVSFSGEDLNSAE